MSSWTDIDWSKVAAGESDLNPPSPSLPPSPHGTAPKPYTDPESDDDDSDSNTSTDSDDDDDDDDDDMFSTMRLSREMLANYKQTHSNDNDPDIADNDQGSREQSAEGSISESGSGTDSTGSVIIRESSDDDYEEFHDIDDDDNDDDDDDDDDDDWGATVRIDATSLKQEMTASGNNNNEKQNERDNEEEEEEEDWDAELGLDQEGAPPRMKLSLSGSKNDQKHQEGETQDDDGEDWDAEIGIDTTQSRPRLKLSKSPDQDLTPSSPPPKPPSIVKEDRSGMWAYVEATGTDEGNDNDAPPLRRMQHAVAAWEKDSHPSSHVLILFGGRVDGYEPGNDLYFGRIHTRRQHQHSLHVSWSMPSVHGPVPVPSFGHAMLVDHRRRLLFVVGGHDGSHALSHLHRLHLPSHTWQRLPDMPTPRYAHTAVLHGPDRIVVYGGCCGETHPDTVDVYDIGGDTWHSYHPSVSPSPEPEQDNNNNLDNHHHHHHHSSPVSHPRRQHAAVVVDHRMYIIGGADSTYSYCDDVYILDLESMVWHPMPVNGPQPPPRIGHTAVVDRKGVIYVFGGRQENCFNDVWILRDHQWRLSRFRGDVPQPRESHAACMLGTRLAVFGGISGMKILSDLHVLETDPSRARRMPRHTRTATILAPEQLAAESTSHQHRKLELPSQKETPDSSQSSSRSSSVSSGKQQPGALHLPTPSVLSSAISSAHLLGAKDGARNPSRTGTGTGTGGGPAVPTGDIYEHYMHLQEEVASKDKSLQSLERILQRKNKEILQLTQNERSLKQEIERLRQQLEQS